MYCWKCGTNNNEGAKFCNSCGADLNRSSQPPETSTLCKACGNPILPEEKYCSKCLVMEPGSGGVVNSSPAASSTKAHGILFWGAIIGGLIIVLIICVALVTPSKFGILGISTGVPGQYVTKGTDLSKRMELSRVYSEGFYTQGDLILKSDGTWSLVSGFHGGTWKVEGNILRLTHMCVTDIFNKRCITVDPDTTYRIEGNELIPISGDTTTWVKWR